MASLSIIAVACIIIGFGRAQIRRARRRQAGMFKRLVGWMVLAIGFVVMIVGVLAWK